MKHMTSTPKKGQLLEGKKKYLVVALIAVLVVVPAASALQPYLFATQSAPVVVNEPVAILQSPSPVTLTPGTNTSLDITLVNIASVTYNVSLNCLLSGYNPSTTSPNYQALFVSFTSDTSTYTVPPNQTDITVWMSVDPLAPLATTAANLTVTFTRD